MANDGKVSIQLVAEGVATIERDLARVKSAMDGMGNAAQAQGRKINEGYSAASRGVRSISEQLREMQNLMAGGAGAIAAVASVRQLGAAMIDAQVSAQKLRFQSAPLVAEG